MNKSSKEKLLTVDDLVSRFRIGRTNARQLMLRLPHVSEGNVLRVRWSDLDAWERKGGDSYRKPGSPREYAPFPLGKRERFKALERSGFKCVYCGRPASEVPLQVDHVIPRCKGGTNEPSNLVAACRDCNLGKSGLLLERFPGQP